MSEARSSEVELKHCPKCDGQGRDIRVCGKSAEEYIECWFCCDRLKMTQYEIELRNRVKELNINLANALSEIFALKSEKVE